MSEGQVTVFEGGSGSCEVVPADVAGWGPFPAYLGGLHTSTKSSP